MLVKEFIKYLKKLPQTYEITTGNCYQDIFEKNVHKYNFDLYDLCQTGKKSKHKITILLPE